MNLSMRCCLTALLSESFTVLVEKPGLSEEQVVSIQQQIQDGGRSTDGL